MAKELPYFKFEPSEWGSGSIQMCSYEAQGLFINICSLYWSRLGDLPERLAVNLLCKGYANALQELCNEQILHIKDGMIQIKFLDEQLEEFASISNERSKAAKKRWSKHPGKQLDNANAMQMHSKSNAIRGEEIRKEEIKVDKKREDDIEGRKLKFAYAIKEFNNQYDSVMLREFYEYWTEPNKSKTKFRQELEKTWDLERRLRTWASREKFSAKNKPDNLNHNLSIAQKYSL